MLTSTARVGRLYREDLVQHGNLRVLRLLLALLLATGALDVMVVMLLGVVVLRCRLEVLEHRVELADRLGFKLLL